MTQTNTWNESLAKAWLVQPTKKFSVIFRSKENKLPTRPNAFIVTVGKKGYTSVRQSNYWAVDTVNSCKASNEGLGDPKGSTGSQ